MDGLDLPVSLKRFVQGADVFMTIVVVFGVLAEVILMWWAIRTILRAVRTRRANQAKAELERLRRR